MTQTSVETSREAEPEDELVQLRREVEQLRFALHHRPETDRVVGMIMLAASCSADTAWGRLSTLSQHTNRKVRDVAAAVSAHVASGHGLPTDIAAVLRDMLPPSKSAVRTVSPLARRT